MSRSLVRACVLLPLALFAACGDDDTVDTPTSPTTPTTITEPLITGSISRNGASVTAFVANTGAITATLKTLSPDTALVGLALGEWNSTTGLCSLKLTSEDAGVGKVLIGAAQVTSNYCVRIADSQGTLSGAVSYEIEIVHF